MKVYIGVPRGFCAGVVRAVDIVELALEKFGPPVYVKHQIVHNPYVVKSLEDKGAITVEDVDVIHLEIGVSKSGSPISRWMTSLPSASNLRAFARTSNADFIPSETLMMDEYCQKCHPDIHEAWAHSVHRFGSFNNPAYLFSVKQTRHAMMERDGSVQGSRFCAGCHDPERAFTDRRPVSARRCRCYESARP